MASRQRKSDGTLGRKPSTPGKLPVAEPTTVWKFMQILVMHICGKILLVDTRTKLGIYLCGVTVGSVITDLVPPPRSYFADSRNFVNQYFVKIGWAWTLLSLGLFVLLTSYTYCCGEQKLVRRHLLRLAVGTFWWYTCTKLFNYVEHVTGTCSSGNPDHRDKLTCYNYGYLWQGFDISGHAFLLVHNLLTTSEEAKVIKGWDKISKIITDEENEKSESKTLTQAQLSKLKDSFTRFTPYIQGVVVLLTILTIIWNIMLLTTTLYFHVMPQKLCGVLFAAACWFISYEIFFKQDWSPGIPGAGYIKYQGGSSSAKYTGARS